jgi:hydroxymethylbilane synthase
LLARTQSQQVADAIEAISGDRVELVLIRTRGDAITDRPLGQVGGKGLFTKEIEEALLAGEVDLAVHSYKDLPTEQPRGLVIPAIPARRDPRDVLVGPPRASLPADARVGTGSARRRVQLAAAHPGWRFHDVRGNVDTRARKVEAGELDAVVLAAAGLLRLDRADLIGEALPVDVVIPAVAQGALAVQCRATHEAVGKILLALGDPATEAAVAAERSFLVALGGGCSVPAACHAEVEGDRLRVHAMLADDAGRIARRVAVCPWDDGPAMGLELAEEVRAELAALRDATPGCG